MAFRRRNCLQKAATNLYALSTDSAYRFVIHRGAVTPKRRAIDVTAITVANKLSNL